MLQGRFKPISINQVLASTKLMLGLENTTQNDVFLAMRIEQAAKHLYNNDQRVLKCCEVDIVEGRACLPNGYETLIAVTFVNENGEDAQVCYANTQAVFSWLSTVITGPIYSQPWQTSAIQGGMLVFNNPTVLPYYRCRIWFIGRNVDDNGLTVLHEMEERGLEAYACWQYALRYPRLYTPEQRQEWKMTWIAQKKFLNGKANIDYWRENKHRLGNLMNAWLVRRDFGRV